MEIILGDANAPKKQILMEEESVKKNIKDVISVTLTVLNVERLRVVFQQVTS